MKIILSAFCFAIYLSTIAQVIPESLKDAKAVQVKDGLVLYGREGDESSSKFVAIKYNNNLEQVKQYSKPIEQGILNVHLYINRLKEKRLYGKYSEKGAGVFNQLNEADRRNLLFEVVPDLQGWNQTFIKLDAELKELDFLQNNREVSKDLSSNKMFGKELYYYDGGMLGGVAGGLRARYVTSWKSDLESEKIKEIATLLRNDTVLYVYINYELSRKVLAQYIYCFDLKTEESKFKVQLNKEGVNVFVPSNAIIHNNKLIIVGNYADLSGGPKITINADRKNYMLDYMQGIFIGEMDRSTGSQLNIKTSKNENLDFKEISLFAPEKRVTVFHRIFINDNEITAIGECFLGKNFFPHSPVGFVKYKFDKSLSLIKTAFYPKETVSNAKEGGTYNYHDVVNSMYSMFNAGPLDLLNMNYSFSDCVFDEKGNMTILYNNYVERRVTERNRYTTTYEIMVIDPNEKIQYKKIAGQVDGKDADSKCFLRDANSLFLFIPEEKDVNAQLRIVKF